MSRAFSANIRGKVRNFSLPKNRPMVPLYEAIVNSINAIDERRRIENDFDGQIDIEVLRDETLFSDFDKSTVLGFKIIDNGIGFTEENMRSFMEADSDYKLRIGGKGVGRFSWLKAFAKVEIKSTYKENGVFYTRMFDFTLNNADIEDKVESACSQNCGTEVCMSGYAKEYEKNVPKQLSTMAAQIIQHCFAYFLRSDCPKIHIYDSENRICLNKSFADVVKPEENKRNFKVGDKQFSLLNIKITDKTFTKKNRLFLCANERLVDSRDLERAIVNLDSNIFQKTGYWYVGVLTGDYFDENVDMNRLSFDIPAEGDALFPDYPGLQEIEKTACEEVAQYLKEYLSIVEKEKQERIQRYTTEIAPQYRHLLYYLPEKVAALKPGLTDEALADAFYGLKREFENKAKEDGQQLLKILKKGDISSNDYQKQFQETIKRVSDVNRAALADYVVHRRIILDLFSTGLNIKPDGKFNLEKYMHNLIYPMRSTSDETPYENHNLWLLDEKLSFCQFISSDKPFDNAQGEERTDIMILDSPVAMADNKNNGTAYNSIIIFELKKPMRDDYNMANNPITQLIEYVKRIKGGGVKDSNHRKIQVTENTQFYLYALCDITPTLDSVLDNLSFTRTPDNLGAYSYNNVLHAHIEVLSFDKVRNDSEKRNRILFEKLGIN